MSRLVTRLFAAQVAAFAFGALAAAYLLRPVFRRLREVSQ